jgi:hypothetical protein
MSPYLARARSHRVFRSLPVFSLSQTSVPGRRSSPRRPEFGTEHPASSPLTQTIPRNRFDRERNVPFTSRPGYRIAFLPCSSGELATGDDKYPRRRIGRAGSADFLRGRDRTTSTVCRVTGMEGDGKGAGSGGEAEQAAVDRLLPALTSGMSPEESAKARKTLSALLALRAARLSPAELEKEAAARRKRAEGLSLEMRRKLLREDELALGVEQLSGQVLATALGVLRGEVKVTPEVKRETRRTLARLGQLNAVLVGRFPHLTPLLEQVSDSYLDAMFILGDGQGPLSTRLSRAKKEREPAGKPG